MMTSQTVSIGIIGDFNQNMPAHKATNEAIKQAADKLLLKVNATWLPTASLSQEGQPEQLDGLWAAPGSYQSPEGALRVIQMARETERPFIGT